MEVKNVRKWKEEIAGVQFEFINSYLIKRLKDGEIFRCCIHSKVKNTGEVVCLEKEAFSIIEMYRIIIFDPDCIHVKLENEDGEFWTDANKLVKLDVKKL